MKSYTGARLSGAATLPRSLMGVTILEGSVSMLIPTPGTPWGLHPHPRAAEQLVARGHVRKTRLVVRATTRFVLCLTILALSAWGGETRATAAGPSGTWQQLTTDAQPPARSQYGMAADSAGHVYIYGGRGADGTALGDFWVLRPADGSWHQLASGGMPPLIEPHIATDAAGKVFEFGGLANPPADHLSFDGHSYGLYEYDPALDAWSDLTRVDAQPGTNWPPGREDHGFAFDPGSGRFLTFAGEGNEDQSLNDLWSYDETSNTWTQRQQSYDAPNGAQIAPREIYNISSDNHGGFYLFGGAYLTDANNQPIGPTYANDLWRLDVASGTWTLLAGTANGYDPAMPLPRHYYGQLCDDQGDFYVLGGYLSDSASPPFFDVDQFRNYAQALPFGSGDPAGIQTYALADFWQFNPGTHTWVDRSEGLGQLQGSIPYNMALDRADGLFVTFGGFHALAGMLVPSSGTWTYSPEPGDLDPQPPTPTATLPPLAAPATVAPLATTTFPTPTDTPTALASPVVAPALATFEPAPATPRPPAPTPTAMVAPAMPGRTTPVPPASSGSSALADPQTAVAYQDPPLDLVGIVPIPGSDTSPPLPYPR